jgi:hypothetical protein
MILIAAEPRRRDELAALIDDSSRCSVSGSDDGKTLS